MSFAFYFLNLAVGHLVFVIYMNIAWLQVIHEDCLATSQILELAFLAVYVTIAHGLV